MKTTEDYKDTSRHLYEDEHVFLNEEEELYLKAGNKREQRKLCEVSKDAVEAKLDSLQEAFDDLQKEVEQTMTNDDLSEDTLSELEDEVVNAQAVGNFDILLTQIQEKKAAIKQGKTASAEETKQDYTSSKKKEETDQSRLDGASALADKQNNEKSDYSDSSDLKEDKQDGTGSDSDNEVYFYKNIVKKADELAKQSDWSFVSEELDILSRQWSEGPDIDSEEIKKLFQKFNRSINKFQKRKEEHYQQQKDQKQNNLEKKKKLLSEFEGIISNQTWTATRRVSQLKSQWNRIGRLPSGKGEGLDEHFEELLHTFDEHKVDRLVQKRQKQEDNLMLKLTVLEKMEKHAESIDHETTRWKEIGKQFDKLTRQWKKIGRVPKEKSDKVWDRYKDAQDKYYDQKYRYDKEHQSKVDKFRHRKQKICEEAEALLEEKDIASAARKINKLHRRWKKAGNLPQREENKLWARFKAATNEFNERKSNNQDKIHEQEQEHYQQKLELIDKANALKNTDEFKKGHDKMQSFMNRWKQIGPVPRNKSNQIWKQFKGAMDEFYDRRREHFKEVKQERKNNLEEKEEILEKLQTLGSHEDPIKAVEIAKELQETFKDAGYVPIQYKDKMWKKYREACDVIYDRFRAAKSGDKFDQELAKADLNANARNKIQKLRKEFKKLKKEARNLEKQMIQWKEKKTYFKPSDGRNPLLDEVENKIEKFDQQLDKKNKKMDSLTNQMEEIRIKSEE